MAEKYQVRKFEPVNNSSYQFFEVAVNGKFQFQEFVDNLKDEQRDLKKLNAIYGYMDSLSPSNLLPKTKFRSIKCKKCKNVYEFKKNDKNNIENDFEKNSFKLILKQKSYEKKINF